MVERIRELCKKNGTSIFKLEKQLGFGNGVIGRWDKSVPNYARLSAVAEALQTTPEYLTGRSEDPYPWDRDPDDRLANVAGPRWDALLDAYDGDYSRAWAALESVEQDQKAEAEKMGQKEKAPTLEVESGRTDEIVARIIQIVRQLDVETQELCLRYFETLLATQQSVRREPDSRG